MKHPFSFLRESEYFPHARTLRTSLWQKFKDSFKVFYGDMSKSSNYGHEDPEPTLGLFDILVIPTLIALANNWIQKSDSNRVLKGAIFVVNFLFNTAPRSIFSALFALVALVPITLPVHFISKAVDHFSSDSLDVALSAESVTRDTYDDYKNITVLKKQLERQGDYDIENIKCTKLNQGEVAVFYQPPLQLRTEPLLRFSILSSDPAVKALFSHNIGGIAAAFPERAKELAEAEVESGPRFK